MRDHATRQQVRRLYILGAGASYDASQHGEYSAPLDKNALAEIYNLKLEKPHWFCQHQEFVNGKYKGEAKLTATGLELAVIQQLGQLDFLKVFHPKRAKDNVDPTEWLDKLNALLCVRLNRSRLKPAGPYQTLAKSVLKHRQPGKPQDRIITFNYDTLLDDILREKVSPQDLYFGRILDTESSIPAARQTSAPLLLKLHGSTNWRCCKEDLHKSIHAGVHDGPHHISAIWIDNNRPSPDSDSRPLIVPPLPNKPITSVSILKYLWNKAYEYLYEADELYIAGYSLPATDTLAKAMFSSFVNDHIKKIHIADPDGSMLNRWREVLSRRTVTIEQWRYSPSFAEMMKSDC